MASLLLEQWWIPSTLRFTGGGTKFGDYEPGMSHIEMRTWQGGRGLEELADDPSRYFDSRDAWTLTPARLLPSLKPQYVQRDGHITSSLSADVEWKPLLSGQRFLATSFVPVSDYNASRAYLWLRRRGYPGIVTCTLRSDSAGAPGTVLKTATWTPTGSELDTPSTFHLFGFTAETLGKARAILQQLPQVDVTLMTHFAEADGERGVGEQLARFRQMAGDWSGPVCLANSAAILHHPQTHGDWVRPGIMLYGASPFAGVSAESLGLKPVMTLESAIEYLKEDEYAEITPIHVRLRKKYLNENDRKRAK